MRYNEKQRSVGKGEEAMRLAVIADIHSNHYALEDALLKAERAGVEGILFLGDYVSDCPDPQKTMKLLYEAEERMPCWFVRGNREDYMLNHHRNPEDGWCDGSSTGSLLYTYENLTEKDLAFFENMPVSQDICLPGYPAITICHGSPADSMEWILTRPQVLEAYVEGMRGDLLLCGHTHLQREVLFGERRALFCPSVGLPQDEENGTGMAILECRDGRWEHEWIPVSFDEEALISDIEKSGLLQRAPYWALSIIASVREKRNVNMECIRLARSLMMEDLSSRKSVTGETSINKNRSIAEPYWQEAAKRLGLNL